MIISTKICKSQVFFIFLALLLSCSCTAPYAQSLSSRSRIVDPRLLKKINISNERVYLGQLLELISKDSGVLLSIESEDIYSGIILSAHCKDITLYELMNAIWSLLSYKHAAWEWAVVKHGSTLEYRLRPSNDFRDLNGRLAQAMQIAFEEQAAVMFKFAYMSPKERIENVNTLARAMKQSNTKIAKTYVADTPSNEKWWSVLRLVNEILTPDQLQQILHGGRADVPIENLSDPFKQITDSLPKVRTRTFENGVEKPDLTPDILHIFYTKSTGAHKEVSPKLMIGRGRSSMSFIGILDMGFNEIVAHEWMLPGDVKDGPSPSKSIKLKQDIIPSKRMNAQERLNAVAETANGSVLAILPEIISPDLSDPSGNSIKSYLDTIEKNAPFLIHKWKGNCLMVSYPEWFIGDDALYPYSLSLSIRKSVAKNNGYITFADIVKIAVSSNEFQLKRLRQEFTIGDITGQNASIAQFCCRFPKAFSAEGINIDQNLANYLSNSGFSMNIPYQIDSSRIRIIEEDDNKSKPNVRLTQLQIRTLSGIWQNIAGITRERMIEEHAADVKNSR